MLVLLYGFSVNAKESLQSVLNEQLKAESTLSTPGFVIRVQRGFEVLHDVASGAADIEQGRAIDTKTVFHIASLSKQITAAAVAHAIRDGLVTLDDSASQWIPTLKQYDQDITVAHLMFMTSGLTEYYNVPRKNGMPWSTHYYFSVPEAVEASLSVKELRFKPGTEWQYSNINYMLLTEIVAAVYDKPFSAVVQEKIFQPLGMQHSLINDDITAIVRNRANAYTRRNESILSQLRDGGGITALNDGDWIMIRRNAAHYGGSGVMTSMHDWSLWQAELLSHKTFGKAFWDVMFSTRKFDHSKANDAFGLVWSDRNGEKILWYEGGDMDASSYAVSFPGKNLSVSCFSNDPTGNCGSKVRLVLDRLQDAGKL